jgi:hypothetical protein
MSLPKSIARSRLGRAKPSSSRRDHEAQRPSH